MDTILNNLKNSDVVLCLLSKSYLQSPFCIAEAGAGQLREKMKRRTFFTLVVPPVTFTDIDEGILHGVQSGVINISKYIDMLRDRVAPPKSSTPDWTDAKDHFLQDIKNPIGLEHIITVYYEFERSYDSRIGFKSKFRVVFTNETGETIQVEEPVWHAASKDVPAKPKQFKTPLQIEDGLKGWEKNRWIEERKTPPYPVDIAPGTTFRTWIGLVEHIPPWELQQRHSKLGVGTLEIPIRIQGKDVGIISRRF